MPRPVDPWLRVALAMTAVGWGANQFAGLLVVYRDTAHLSEAFVSIAVGVYAAGLIPALLGSAAVADRFDRRSPVRLAVGLSALGSLLLMLGAQHEPLIQVGRFVAGLATGAVLGPGTAWVMDLSSRLGTGTGARRATVALSLGFGGGPLVAGLVAQWAPYPEVAPYVAHLVLSVPALLLVWNAPVPPHVHDPAGPSRRAEVGAVLRSRTFLGVVPLTAPWVFGVATTAFAIAPVAVTVTVLPVATNACVTGLTLGAGVAVQPLAKRMERRARGRTLWVGLVLAGVGLLLTALAFELDETWLLFGIALVLGTAYGLLLVGGLSRVELVSHPDDRATVSAVYYALTYLGFAAPYLFVLLTAHVLDPVALLLLGALVAAVSVAVVLAQPPAPAAASGRRG